MALTLGSKQSTLQCGSVIHRENMNLQKTALSGHPESFSRSSAISRGVLCSSVLTHSRHPFCIETQYAISISSSWIFSARQGTRGRHVLLRSPKILKTFSRLPHRRCSLAHLECYCERWNRWRPLEYRIRILTGDRRQ